MKRAAIYARYSSHNQREESIEIQLEKCREYCEENALEVVCEYCDYAQSGRTSDRVEFQRMMQAARAGDFDVVVIWKVTRIMRNRDEMAVTRLALKDAGVEIAYAGESFPTGSSGMLMLGMLEVLAEWESAQTAERIRDGVRKNGEELKASGVRIFGYAVDEDDRFVIDEDKARAVRLAFQTVDDGGTVADAVRALAPWRSKWGRPIVHQSVMNMLRNRRYTGRYEYAGTVKEGGMPAIIDKAQFDRVQRRIEYMRKERAPRKPAIYPLSGRLFDADGRKMTGQSATGRGGKVHRYYCVKGAKDRVRKDDLEGTVADAVLDALKDSRTREAIARMVEEWQCGRDTGDGPARAELADVEKRMARIWDAIEDGLPADRDRLKQLGARRDELKALIEASRAELDYDHALFFLEQAASMPAEDVVRTFVDRVEYGGGSVSVRFRFDARKNETARVGGSSVLNLVELSCPGTNRISVFPGGFIVTAEVA